MDRLRLMAAYTILALWVGSVILNAADRTYNPPPTINILAGAVVTALFGAPYVLRHRDSDG